MRERKIRTALAPRDYPRREAYCFGEGPSDPADYELTLGTSTRGRSATTRLSTPFYVDVTQHGDPVTPEEVADRYDARAVIDYVHQIG